MTTLLSLQRLAFPLILGQLAFALNGFVTGFFLSKSSATAFHASLPASMLATTFSVVFISTLGYSGTVFARLHGAGDADGARRVFAQTLLLSVFSIPLFLLAVPAGKFVLSFFNTVPEVLEAESSYFTILVANGYFTALAAVLSGPFTGQGKTRLAGAVTAGGFILNMILSAVLINGFAGIPAYGVKGAGWAATIAHIVPCIVLAAALVPGGIMLKAKHFVPDGRTIPELLRLGLPNGIKSFIDVGGFFVFTAFLAECLGGAVAASTAAFAVNGVFQAFPQGVAQALEIVVARGERKSLSAGLRLAGIYVAAFAALIALAGTGVFGIFKSGGLAESDNSFAATAGILVLILCGKSATESLTILLQAFLRGKGDTAAVFRIQFFASCCFWMPLYFAVRQWCPGIPLYWITMLACSALTSALLARRIATRFSLRR